MRTVSEAERYPVDEQARSAVLARLMAAEKLIVVAHERPDGDALGSLVAMREILTAIGKDCLMFIAPDDVPVPYEYRSLSLNGLVQVAPDDLSERVAVFLDCGKIDRSPAAAEMQAAAGVRELINIDHHHDNTQFGTVNFVVPEASCTAEIIWSLLSGLGATLTRTIAEALYIGLITDTGCFMYENTGTKAHLMAADLIAAGVDVHAAYEQVYEGVPDAKVALLAKGLSNLERFDGGLLTATHLSAEDFYSSGAVPSHSEGIVDHLRAMRGTAVAAIARDMLGPDREPVTDAHGARVRKVSLRATDIAIDVSAIAREQGGGGHRAAAGFSTTLDWPGLVVFLREQVRSQRDAK